MGGGSSNCEQSKTCSGVTVRIDSLGEQRCNPGRQLGRHRLLTSPSFNWLLVKPSYERKGSWCAGAHETGVMPLKIKDAEFIGSQCFQLEQSSGGVLVP